MKKTEILKNAMNYVNKLLTPLENFYYHQYNHSIEVMERAMYLWEKEWLNKDDIEMLWLAGLFHDTGFIIQYDNNEYIWAKIAKNYLKTILYSEEKIKLIEEIILATAYDYKVPKNIYEEIIKDADLDNLWREDFFDKKDAVKKELELIRNIKIKDPDWNHGSLELLKDHKYFTKTQQKEREKQKLENRKVLEEMMEELAERWVI